uniref:Uncharacterized protein n=1 Tax=Globodera rostochiensis TaxID=31243 RepID=A0A914IBX7_GLORO
MSITNDSATNHLNGNDNNGSTQFAAAAIDPIKRGSESSNGIGTKVMPQQCNVLRDDETRALLMTTTSTVFNPARPHLRKSAVIFIDPESHRSFVTSKAKNWNCLWSTQKMQLDHLRQSENKEIRQRSGQDRLPCGNASHQAIRAGPYSTTATKTCETYSKQAEWNYPSHKHAQSTYRDQPDNQHFPGASNEWEKHHDSVQSRTGIQTRHSRLPQLQVQPAQTHIGVGKQSSSSC